MILTENIIYSKLKKFKTVTARSSDMTHLFSQVTYEATGKYSFYGEKKWSQEELQKMYSVIISWINQYNKQLLIKMKEYPSLKNAWANKRVSTINF